MDYLTLLETVIDHLEGLGVECTAVAGGPVSDEELAAAEAGMKVRLPAELREFYQEIGDGVVLFWESAPDDYQKPWGSLQVPSLSSLADMYAGWRGLVLWSPEKAEEYGFPYTKDPALAKRAAARMWHWLPLIDHPNGDAICLDLGDPSGPVVFDKHDWMDGGTGDNGHPLAPNWLSFLTAWGGVCFQNPVHWSEYFRPGGGMDWDGEPFHSPFRVVGLCGPDTAATPPTE